MNMKQILNDPELSKELDKAYAIAAPYRARVQFKLAILLQSIERHSFWNSLVLDASGICLIAAYCDKPYIHPILRNG